MKRLFTLASVCATLTIPALASETDFTVRGRGDDSRYLPHRLTAGTWFYTVTYEAFEDGRAPRFHLEHDDDYDDDCDDDDDDHDDDDDDDDDDCRHEDRRGSERSTCNGSPLARLTASARNERLTVGPSPADICAGWHEVENEGGRVRSWSVRFTKQASRSDPPGNGSDPDCPSNRACMESGFVVKVEWRDPDSGRWSTAKRQAQLGADSAVFWFFDKNNAEVLVKVLNACKDQDEGHWWVFAAPATDLRYRVTVWPPDASRGTRWTATPGVPAANPAFVSVSALADTRAFPCRW